MNSVESIFFWTATVLVAAIFSLMLGGIVFKRTSFYRTAQVVLIPAFLSLTVFGILRWTQSNHPPFVTLFESMITSVWFMLAALLSMKLLSPRSEILLLPASFGGFLLLGWASSLPAEASPLSLALSNTWLFIHASFATAGAASFLVAASYAAIFLVGEKRLTSWEAIAARFPEYSTLSKSMLNFVVFGLILWGVMIVSGSIWANAAWGRYWAWDPIELWSLISWLIYGLLLHSRLAFKVSSRTFAWMTIAAMLTVAFALWGVGYIYETIHTYG